MARRLNRRTFSVISNPSVKPSRAPDLASQRDGFPELDHHHGPLLPAPVRMQHHTHDTVDAEPGMPEARVVYRGHMQFRQIKPPVNPKNIDIKPPAPHLTAYAPAERD